ncbi:MAG: hypothetical protein H6925_02460 [Holosporaceae bacterium]|nr:MAG: hypothetical protein H6925_02460 [Holosporaceae bacterium]
MDTSLIGDTDAPPYDVFDITEALQKEYPYDYPRPARMRPEILEQEHPIRVLTDDQQAKADRIFSAPPHTITYQEFESLWTSLGDLCGEKRVASYHDYPRWRSYVGHLHPHGGHNYGPHGIKNLRAALYWMGCRPTE